MNDKIIKVIKSCKTKDHLDCCFDWIISIENKRKKGSISLAVMAAFNSKVLELNKTKEA